MITLTAAQQAAIAKRAVSRRIFVWVDALDPDTGDPDPAGFWNDVGVVTVDGRTYNGSGTLGQVQTLAADTDLTIPGLQVTLSGLPPEVANLVRGSTVSQRPIRVDIGLFDTDNNTLIDGLIPRFAGKVDDIAINTPAARGQSTIVLTCESTSRALTIERTDTRSDATQHERDPNDDIFQYTNAMREKAVFFGRRDRRRDSGSSRSFKSTTSGSGDPGRFGNFDVEDPGGDAGSLTSGRL